MYAEKSGFLKKSDFFWTMFLLKAIAFNKMFAAPECQTYSLAVANRGLCQTVSSALRIIFMLKAL
jgi:hypothetical protein